MNLAAEIQQHTQRIDDYVSKNRLAQHSFDVDGPKTEDLLAYPPEIASSRAAVLRATTELNELLQGPMITRDIASHVFRMIHLQLIYRHKIVDRVPLQGDITYEDLAALIGMEVSPMRRILRHAITWRLFQEKTAGRISHSAASILLLENQESLDWLGFAVESSFPGVLRTVDAIGRWPDADEAWQTGSMLAHGTKDSKDNFYDYLSKNPEQSRRFGSAMSLHTKADNLSLSHVVDSLDWSKSSLVVDVGGNNGEAAFAIAEAFPTIRKIIVQDVAQVVTTAATKPGLNVSFMEHNFFAPQPVKNADVYFLRNILHNWTDKDAVQILRALIPALKCGATVLIADEVLPPQGSTTPQVERTMR